MDVEARKSFQYGFVLREADLRRLVDTITDQFRKLGLNREPTTHFKLKFRNGVVADNLGIDDVLGQENSGPGQILRLSYTCTLANDDTPATVVSLEFVNADADEEPGYVSMRFHVFGHDRDWVFVTSSLLEERIERIRRWAANQWGSSKHRNPFIRLAGLLSSFVLVIVVAFTMMTTMDRTTKHEVAVRQITKQWRNGAVKDPVAVILAIEEARLQDLHALPSQAFPVRPLAILFGALFALVGLGAFAVRYYPVYNFCWGEYLEWFAKREAARRFWLTVIATGFLISFLASILANRIKW